MMVIIYPLLGNRDQDHVPTRQTRQSPKILIRSPNLDRHRGLNQDQKHLLDRDPSHTQDRGLVQDRAPSLDRVLGVANLGQRRTHEDLNQDLRHDLHAVREADLEVPITEEIDSEEVEAAVVVTEDDRGHPVVTVAATVVMALPIEAVSDTIGDEARQVLREEGPRRHGHDEDSHLDHHQSGDVELHQYLLDEDRDLPSTDVVVALELRHMVT